MTAPIPAAAVAHYAALADRLRGEGLTDPALLAQIREALVAWYAAPNTGGEQDREAWRSMTDAGRAVTAAVKRLEAKRR